MSWLARDIISERLWLGVNRPAPTLVALHFALIRFAAQPPAPQYSAIPSAGALGLRGWPARAPRHSKMRLRHRHAVHISTALGYVQPSASRGRASDRSRTRAGSDSGWGKGNFVVPALRVVLIGGSERHRLHDQPSPIACKQRYRGVTPSLILAESPHDDRNTRNSFFAWERQYIQGSRPAFEEGAHRVAVRQM